MPLRETAPSRTRSACPVCSGTRFHYLFSIGEFRVVCCDDCGVLASSVRQNVASFVKSGSGLERYAGRESGVLGTVFPWREVLGQLKAYGVRKPERVLLVGFPGRDLDAHLSQDAVSPAVIKRVPLPLASSFAEPFVDDWLAEERGSELFDVIVLDEALHVFPDPRRLLTQAHRMLDPNGALIVAAPLLDSWARRDAINGAGETLPAGSFYFNVTTLQSLLFHASFRELEVHGKTGRPREGDSCFIFARPVPVRPNPLLSVIVPVYNEAATAAEILRQLVVKEIHGLQIEIIIIESNSSDGSRDIVQHLAGHDRVKLILEDRPRGKGHAVRTALQRATGDFVLIQDADLEYDLEDYEALLEPLMTGKRAFVLGARHGGNTWKIRRFTDQPLQALALNVAHHVFTLLINVSLGLRLDDPFTMFKVFRRDCLHGLRLECNRFDFDWELLIKLVRKGYRPLEIPVNYRSRSFKEGKKIRMFRDPWTWLIAWARARFGPLGS